MDRLLPINKAAELLGVSKWLLYSYIRKGYIKTVHIDSGHLKIATSDIQDFIKRLRQDSIPSTKREPDELDKALKKIQSLANNGK